MDKEKLKKELDEKQEIVNQLYEKWGLTDEILDLQVEINSLRHEYDLVDESEIVYDKFVQ